MWEHSLASTKQKANLASTKQKATASPAQNKRPQHSQQPFWPPTAAILATNSSHFGHQQAAIFGHRNFPTVYLPDS
jgi:hypothetical protein